MHCYMFWYKFSEGQSAAFLTILTLSKLNFLLTLTPWVVIREMKASFKCIKSDLRKYWCNKQDENSLKYVTRECKCTHWIPHFAPSLP